MIGHMEVVLKHARQVKGSWRELSDSDISLQKCMEFFSLNKVQSILFSTIFLTCLEEEDIEITDIAEKLKCKVMYVAVELDEIRALSEKRLVRTKMRFRHRKLFIFGIDDSPLRSLEISLPITVFEAVLRNDINSLKEQPVVDAWEFIRRTDSLTEQRSDDEISTLLLIEEFNKMCENCADVTLVQTMQGLGLETDDMIFLVQMIHTLTDGDEEMLISWAAERMYEYPRPRINMINAFVSGRNKLVAMGLVKVYPGMFRSKYEVKFTPKGRETLFKDELEILLKSSGKLSLKKVNKKPENLYYNTNEEKPVKELERLLEEKTYKDICDRLKEKGMPEGLTILLYGKPGTGKTSTAYQVAVETGRPVIPVDIAGTKSMWYGENERLIKEVFDEYQRYTETSELIPILLFNECDGIFSKRKDTHTSSVAQTENAVQNIILDELEHFKGILIATTNLTQNLDKAFERRFLYKINFNLPDANIRLKIWNDRFPWLKNSELKECADRFSLTGGQIQNIQRRVILKEVLNGEKASAEQIMKLCYEESSSFSEKQWIGFGKKGE